MSISNRQRWITGEEFGEERVRLIKAGLHDSPEMKALIDRVVARDNEIWDMYAGPLKAAFPNQWAAISPNGEHIVCKTSGEAISQGTERFGAGNFVFGRLAEFRGFQM